MSNHGSDLQDIDTASGLPDLAYHLAWELGRIESADRVYAVLEFAL